MEQILGGEIGGDNGSLPYETVNSIHVRQELAKVPNLAFRLQFWVPCGRTELNGISEVI